MDTVVFEIIGYVSSILIAISLMMSSILRLRIINLIGAVLFTIYGLGIRAYPVAAVNFLIVLIDLYYLIEMFRARDYFTLLEMQPDSDYLLAFLKFYDSEIRRFLPDFRYQPGEGQLAFFALRNMVPAGLFIGRRDGADTLRVDLDFVIPGYRDFKIARYVFGEKAGFFRERGIHSLCSVPGTPAHESYLRRMGFERAAGDDLYELHIDAVGNGK